MRHSDFVKKNPERFEQTDQMLRRQTPMKLGNQTLIGIVSPPLKALEP